MATLGETIREVSRRHLEEGGGLLLGQCVSAVGWVNGTVPDCKGIVELPMTDVAGAGFAVGAAMVGRRPIFVLRFQDFLILNCSPIVNYAAKSKELFGKASPVFLRALASENIGPVHSGVFHSMMMHFPGLRVCSPVTPGEYQQAWDSYMQHDDPMVVSEHRDSYKNTEELPDLIHPRARLTLYPISITRFAAVEAARMLESEGIPVNVVHLMWLKPFDVDARVTAPLRASGLGLVVDPGFEICGAARSIAYELQDATDCKVRAVGLMDRTKCLRPPLQNRSPDKDVIARAVRALVEGRRLDGPAQEGVRNVPG
jgi:pyruvate/2-oxoglutarate/acetoin dehydrogenase E1 component